MPEKELRWGLWVTIIIAVLVLAFLVLSFLCVFFAV